MILRKLACISRGILDKSVLVCNITPVRYVSSGKNLPILTLYTKNDCSLCEEAMEILKPYRHKFQLEEVDITLPENKEWFIKYRYDIPVFHFNGEFLMKHRANIKLFQRKLDKFEKEI